MPQDLRMVVLALSPRAAVAVRAVCESIVTDATDEDAATLQAVINEIDEHLDNLPSAEEYAANVGETADRTKSTVTETVVEDASQTVAAQVADKMAKASRAATEGDPNGPVTEHGTIRSLEAMEKAERGEGLDEDADDRERQRDIGSIVLDTGAMSDYAVEHQCAECGNEVSNDDAWETLSGAPYGRPDKTVMVHTDCEDPKGLNF